MNFLDLLNQAGGQQSLGALGKGLGLDSAKTGDLISSLAPALMRSIGKQADDKNGLSALQGALESGNHQRYLDQPELMSEETATEDGNNILGHLFGSKDVSRNVAAQAAEATGIDVSLIKKALPLIAGLAMGAVSKKSDSGQALGGSDSGILGSLLGGSDGVDLDDLMGFAKKLF